MSGLELQSAMSSLSFRSLCSESKLWRLYHMGLSAWLLARLRSYLLAVASSIQSPNIAVTLDISAQDLSPAEGAWLLEVPQGYACAFPIEGRWAAYRDGNIITYYRGDLAKAELYSMHLCQPRLRTIRSKNGAFAILCNGAGEPVTRTTLYLWELRDPTDRRNSVEIMPLGALEWLM